MMLCGCYKRPCSLMSPRCFDPTVADLLHCVICRGNLASALVFLPLFVEHVSRIESRTKRGTCEPKPMMWIVLASSGLLQPFHWVWCSDAFVPPLMERWRETLWSFRSNWRWLLTFSPQPNNLYLSKRQCGRQMEVVEDQWLRDTCAAQAHASCFTPTAGHRGPAERRGEGELPDQRENQAPDARWECKNIFSTFIDW